MKEFIFGFILIAIIAAYTNHAAASPDKHELEYRAKVLWQIYTPTSAPESPFQAMFPMTIKRIPGNNESFVWRLANDTGGKVVLTKVTHDSAIGAHACNDDFECINTGYTKAYKLNRADFEWFCVAGAEAIEMVTYTQDRATLPMLSDKYDPARGLCE